MNINPFQYGKEVSGENFCNRKKEIEDLLNHMRSSGNLMVYSQRRFGKTSLIKKSLDIARAEGMVTVYADLSSVLSERIFVDVYSRAISQALVGPIDKMLILAKEIFKRLRPTATIDDTTQMPKIELEIDPKESAKNIEDVMDSVERYQKKLGRKIVVCLDEIQEIGRLSTDYLEKVMRSHIQTHKDICYVFCGSKRHLIYEMFNNPNRPFYRSAAPYPIDKIPRNELISFVKSRFKSTSKSINDEAALRIMELCEDHPYYVQYFCHILWDQTTKTPVTVTDVENAVDVLLSREWAAYSNTWDLLPLQQKRMLVALAKKNPDDKMTSGDFLSRFELGYPSVASAALLSLEKKDMVDKQSGEYTIIDVMFRRWILKLYPKDF